MQDEAFKLFREGQPRSAQESAELSPEESGADPWEGDGPLQEGEAEADAESSENEESAAEAGSGRALHDYSSGYLMVKLLKGPVYRSDEPIIFRSISLSRPALRGKFEELGLVLEYDDLDGMAYLRTKRKEEYPNEDVSKAPLPLLRRAELPFLTSFILTWLRLKVSEFDAAGEARYLLTADEIITGLMPYFPAAVNEGSLIRRINGQLSRLQDLGFLRLKKDKNGERYEILRIIKAFINAETLDRLEEKLQERLEAYGAHAAELNAAKRGGADE